MVEVPLRQPNWLGSMICSTSSISYSTTKSSKTLETIAVREIGLKSPPPVMGVTLDTGVTLESLHAVGKKMPDAIEVINNYTCFILLELKLVRRRCTFNLNGRKLCRNFRNK